MKLNQFSVALSLALPVVLMAGCEPSNHEVSSSPSGTETTATNRYADTTNRYADNSEINTRERDTNNLTPGDQGNTAADIQLTQNIRKGLMSDANYSMTAKNIKIITIDGKVTLRGPVNSDSEKSGIDALAKNIAGDGNVDDQLEVKSHP
jgi:hyperosmotically inducible periplasmic protein